MDTTSPVSKSPVQNAFEVFDVCHREILRHLDRLIELVGALQGHSCRDEDRGAASELIAFFSGPAREHNFDEERHVFPNLLHCDDAEVRRAAECLREDHAWLELFWLDIEPQLAAALDQASSFDPAALLAATEVFIALMRDHIALEESLLYPQLSKRLRPAVIRSISREMAAHRARKAGKSTSPSHS